MWFLFKEKQPLAAALVVQSSRGFLTPYGESFTFLPTGREVVVGQQYRFHDSDYECGGIPPERLIGAPKESN